MSYTERSLWRAAPVQPGGGTREEDVELLKSYSAPEGARRLCAQAVESAMEAELLYKGAFVSTSDRLGALVLMRISLLKSVCEES